MTNIKLISQRNLINHLPEWLKVRKSFLFASSPSNIQKTLSLLRIVRFYYYSQNATILCTLLSLQFTKLSSLTQSLKQKSGLFILRINASNNGRCSIQLMVSLYVTLLGGCQPPIHHTERALPSKNFHFKMIWMIKNGLVKWPLMEQLKPNKYNYDDGKCYAHKH